MGRKTKNIHYIYKTTCNVTGKWYVGMHSTCNLEDGYMGSGKILRHSIRKYGVDNHTKEVLEYFDSREELILREIEIINGELISDNLCINLKEGGTGGFSSEEHMVKCSKAGKKSFKDKLINDNNFRNNFIEIKRKDSTKAMLEGKMKPIDYDWTNKKHSNETKQLMSEKKKGTGIGETNSQYGTCWITKDGENKKIKKEDFDSYQLDEWVKGRT